MKNKMICILGKSASGKDTVARYLQDKYNLKPVVSYTTREKRETETEGVEHYFISTQEGVKIIRDTVICASTVINGVLYFATENDINKADIYVIDPRGLKQLERTRPDMQLIPLLVWCDEDEAITRYIERGGTLEEYEKRAAAEDKQFKDFEDNGDYISVCNNKDIDSLYADIDSVLSEIDYFA